MYELEQGECLRIARYGQSYNQYRQVAVDASCSVRDGPDSQGLSASQPLGGTVVSGAMDKVGEVRNVVAAPAPHF